ncbi:hypothetical protein AB0B04_19430 [Streptomyces xinghaiensis]|uniref:Uncharacterized protein n=2 Tax=Streptomyces TaxID=1883 RepID=A0A3R7IZH8_9ACTN|nr:MULTISPECIES: hypothetical protein [Streptomyces]KNE83354.1 hypothetical protein ADZ36_05910 [Streptomyces fradiae]OFA37027.1 hypothetical protein BEN35_29335 [Streptomyces fradiae]PQM20556.1 hypothetical protein Sfr7A_25500 [Streptomyces xinghaiensis]RKM92498.1 hypothetical protein SFRA_024155 [Streptomyces xinghaiensis]RNC70465.1 hypothetical protein DC095_025145 [Streptomyces xinghaiensis]
MTEPGTPAVSWADRMALLKDSTQQRILTTPMPAAAMEQLLADGKATALGRFEASPVHYLDRWWRESDEGWLALDEEASKQLDFHAERYRAAVAAGATAANPAEEADPGTAGKALPSAADPETGAA